MLPFLNRTKMQTGVAVENRQSEEPKEEQLELGTLIRAGIEAYKSNDMQHLTDIVKEIHDCLHEFMDAKKSDTGFHSQNVLAAKEQK